LLVGVSGPALVGGWAFVSTGSPGALGMGFLAATVGPFVGLSSAPYFTLAVKAWLTVGFLASFALLFLGFRFRARGFGFLCAVVGSVGWALTGALGFGPQ
jgi:hypothetical protein